VLIGFKVNRHAWTSNGTVKRPKIKISWYV
jgi:hypothetical protein